MYTFISLLSIIKLSLLTIYEHLENFILVPFSLIYKLHGRNELLIMN